MEHESKHIETFRQEAYELLSDIEDALLDMEQKPDDHECIHRLFRSMHTIKGSGAMFGFDEIAEFTHHVETILDKVREGAVPVTGELIDLVFLARDQIKAMLDAVDVDRSLCDKIVAKLHRLLPKHEAMDAISPLKTPGVSVGETDEGKETLYRIRFRPNPNIMASGMDPARLLDELRDLGECEVAAHTTVVPFLSELEPDKIYFSWDIILTTASTIDAVKEVFIFVEEDSDIHIQPLKEEFLRDDELRPPLGEILVDRGEVRPETVKEVLSRQKRIGEMLVEAGEVSSDEVQSALAEQKVLEKRKAGFEMEGVRISSDKLDNLINLVGEMVIIQSHLSQLVEDRENTEFSAPVKQMERLAGELRDIALDMRMLPIGAIFARFRRLVRDLAVELGKEVDLVVEGSETELDKTIIDRLHNPLVHLIRNSIDHGLHSPEEREQHGKPRKGTIWLRAAPRGARVNITVADDGMGIDTEAVRARALEKGLISKDEDLSEERIQTLIFAPGFSTARETTDLSGRGVGMDVVKREINAIAGTIQINSIKGQGVAVHLSMPLTLVIIEGLHVRVAGRDFVLPVSQVERCEEMKGFHTSKSENRNMLWLKGDLVPFIRLRELFRMSTCVPPVEHIAAVRAGQYQIAIVVDEIIGSITTVIRPLDRLYRYAKGISGATIMGDGTLALIVDVPELIHWTKEDKSRSVDKRDFMTA